MYSFQAHPQPRVVADSLQESEIKKHSKYILELRKKNLLQCRNLKKNT